MSKSRDAVEDIRTIDTVTATANAALPKAGGTMTGVIAGFESTGIDDNATSTAITIDASENVGIGTASPSARFEVKDNGSATGNVIMKVTQDDQSSHYGMSVGNDTYSTTDTDGFLIYQENNGHTYIYNGGAGVGPNIGMPVAGGITFGSDTAAANALDDYEEGTFTPTASAVALSGVTAIYTKIGRVCNIQLDFAFGSNSRTAAMQILNMPFSAIGNGNCSTGYTDSGLSNISWFWQGTTIYCYDVGGSGKQQQNFSGKTIRLGCTVEVY